VVRVLVSECGGGRADAALQSQAGLTALMYAARIGSEACVRELLLRGGAAAAVDAQNR
jgi:ankyrin repeat protein